MSTFSHGANSTMHLGEAPSANEVVEVVEVVEEGLCRNIRT